jgi:TPR repeat protein
VSFEEKNFPLLGLLQDSLGSDRTAGAAEFARARAGGIMEQFRFVAPVYLNMATMPLGMLPGVTPAMRDTTLKSCLDVFERAAAAGEGRDHGDAALFSARCRFYGHGCAQSTPVARMWLEEAERRGSTQHSVMREMRVRLPPGMTGRGAA